MKGYVMNKTNTWIHAMKRSIGPGEKVELDELYLQYGVKYSLAEGNEFLQWLKDIKLKDSEKWRIVFEEGSEVVNVEKSDVNTSQSEITDTAINTDDNKTVDSDLSKREEEVDKEKIMRKKRNSRIKEASKSMVPPIVPTKMGVADIVGLTFRESKVVLPKIMDLKLLKYAYQEAYQLAGKDSLCNEIRKRIKSLEISR